MLFPPCSVFASPNFVSSVIFFLRVPTSCVKIVKENVNEHGSQDQSYGSSTSNLPPSTPPIIFILASVLPTLQLVYYFTSPL